VLCGRLLEESSLRIPYFHDDSMWCLFTGFLGIALCDFLHDIVYHLEFIGFPPYASIRHLLVVVVVVSTSSAVFFQSSP
jgi:hypothetical protein